MARAYTLEERADIATKLSEEYHAKKNGTAQRPSAPASDGKTRKRRGVFNGSKGKLTIDGNIPGYHLHVFNDEGTRIQDAQDNGYEFVHPDEVKGIRENVVSGNGDLGDSRVRFLVGTKDRGDPLYGYLMKIRQEWHDEDMADLEVKNSLVDDAIRKGTITGNNAGMYIPKEGIKLSS